MIGQQFLVVEAVVAVAAVAAAVVAVVAVVAVAVAAAAAAVATNSLFSAAEFPVALSAARSMAKLPILKTPSTARQRTAE